MVLASKYINVIFHRSGPVLRKSGSKNPLDLIFSVLGKKATRFLGKKGRKSQGVFSKKCFLGKKNEKEPKLFL